MAAEVGEQRARVLRRVRPSGSPHPCSAASAGLVLAEVGADLSLWSRSALPRPAPHPHQPWPLAGRGGAVRNDQEYAILAVHVRGLDGMCVGCRAWWARLAPYPCWQVEWATSRQARTSVARFLGGVR
ncbi:hypothetical protein C1A38_23560 [Verrucosispora sp. ts21]|uniref:hypothetical protein n=1 Tax=Verrucosispora sp. ts21 TaxID=2069341 RepID=UPI000C881A4E|nr:hypothetical protein [Verrucosispora sp. ts21]PMR58661.1 hypothetical protein C1A38_23560 [Verrucosispora sp. ts21]